jgi:hypothetical protein
MSTDDIRDLVQSAWDNLDWRLAVPSNKRMIRLSGLDQAE